MEKHKYNYNFEGLDSREILVQVALNKMKKLGVVRVEELEELVEAISSDPGAPVKRCEVCGGLEKPIWECSC